MNLFQVRRLQHMLPQGGWRSRQGCLGYFPSPPVREGEIKCPQLLGLIDKILTILDRTICSDQPRGIVEGFR